MSEQPEDLDFVIETYLDGRMDDAQRLRFEARMSSDSKLHAQVVSATHSVALVQQALGWLTPGDEFDDLVSSKIISITQSGISPVISGGGGLTRHDPDAKLLADPEAAREKQRLIMLGVIAGLLFVLAASAIVYSIIQGMR